MNKGSLFIVSAPSGCGKDTVLTELFKIAPQIKFSISCTSRPERSPADREKYHLISREQFLQMIDNSEFLEHNEYNCNFYGTPRKPVEEWTNSGSDVILEIDINGAANVKRAMPEAVSIFIMPPSFSALEQRLRGRGTESEEEIQNRLKIAAEELSHANEFDYICINDSIAQCVEDILSVIKAQSFTNNKMKKFIQEVEKDAESFNR